MALVAERLTLVRADFHGARAFKELRQRQFTDRHMGEFAPVKQPDGRPVRLLLLPGSR